MYILAGLLVLGLIANTLVKPLKSRIPNAKTQIPIIERESRSAASGVGIRNLGFGGWDLLAAWTAVGLPLAWGTWVTVGQAVVLFSGGR
jgi:hypothetical protein